MCDRSSMFYFVVINKDVYHFQYLKKLGDLKIRTVWISIWDQHNLGKNKLLGEVKLPLTSLNLSDQQDHWYDLGKFTKWLFTILNNVMIFFLSALMENSHEWSMCDNVHHLSRLNCWLKGSYVLVYNICYVKLLKYCILFIYGTYYIIILIE